MPLDCPSVHEVYCIPAAYEDAWTFRGMVLRVGSDGKPFVVTADTFKQIGAKIDVWSWDSIVPKPREGFNTRIVGDVTVFYRASCDKSMICHFEVGEISSKAAPHELLKFPFGSVETYQLDISGADRAGLDRALRSLSVVTHSEGAAATLIPLAELVTLAN